MRLDEKVLRLSACGLALGCLAFAGPLPDPTPELIDTRVLAINQLDAFGLSHTSLGGAQLGFDPVGNLVVSNIGSSGQDGVSIDLGEVRGMSMDIDPGPAGLLAPGTCVEVYHPYAWRDGCIFVKEQNGGSATVGLDGTGAEPSCVTATLLNDGVVVDTLEIPYVAGVGMIDGDIGSDPVSGEAYSVQYRETDWNFVCRLSLPADTQLAIRGSSRGPVIADAIRFVLEGLPPGGANSGAVRVMAANLGGDLTISSESLLLLGSGVSKTVSWSWTPGSVRASALDGAMVQGLDQAAYCQSFPNFWLNSIDPIAPPHALNVANIGSSGCDGVRFIYPPAGPGCGPGLFICPDGTCVPDPALCGPVGTVSGGGRVVLFGGKDPVLTDFLDLDDDGDSLRLGATGSFGGVNGNALGTCEIRNNRGQLEIYADYASLGASIVRVQVYSQGFWIGEYDQASQPGAPLAQITPSPDGIDITMCGKLGGDPLGPPCYVVCTDANFTLFGGGQVLVGDELRILAADSPVTVDHIESFSVTGVGLESFDIRPNSYSDRDDYLYLFGGRMHAEGNAQLSESPEGHLVVSNIGSSGLDGVSVDAVETELIELHLSVGGAFTPDSIFDIEYTGYDDQCPACPTQMISNVHLHATTQDNVRLTTTSFDPLATVVLRLRDAAGNQVGQFSMDQSDEVVIQGSGQIEMGTVRVGSKMSQGSGGTMVSYWVLHVGTTAAGGGGGVTFDSPAGISFPNVDSVEIELGSITQPNERNENSHVTLRKSHDPTGVSGTPGDFVIRKLSYATGGTIVDMLGESRMGITRCESLTPIKEDIIISNIGSSGEDGVCLNLTEGVCNGIDDDCDGIVDELPNFASLRYEILDPTIPPGDLDVFRIGQGPGGEVIEIRATVRNVGGTTAHDVEVRLDLDGVPEPFLLDITARDQFGNPVASENGGSFPPFVGPVAATTQGSSGSSSGNVETSHKVEEAGSLGGGSFSTVPADTHLFEWDFDYDGVMARSGQTFQGARSLELTVRPIAPLTIDHFDTLSMLMTAPAGETSSYALSDLVLDNVPPPCIADLNGDGILDNGDIQTFLAFFLGGDIRADLNGDGILDNGDIQTFLTAFLAGCP